MNEARDRILDRIRAAMREKAPRREPQDKPKPWFPELPDDPETRIARFAQELTTLKGEFHRAANENEARGKLRELCEQNQLRKVAASEDSLLRKLLEGQEVNWINATGVAGASLESFDVGITRADALAARTGSILLSSRTGTGRALSVLPPTHLVVARNEELVADIGEGIRVWQRIYGANIPSNCFIISGPSRTADIEKVLVLGAHGPKRLIVCVVG